MEYLFKRILKAIELLEKNNQTKFAEKIGCKQSTFNNYLSPEDQAKIRLTLLEDILTAYPELSRYWLYFNEGPMLREETAPPALTAKNKKKLLTGDLLQTVLDFSGINSESVAKNTKIDSQTLNHLLESRVKPDFEELEELYLKLNINPSYFFDGNEKTMLVPDDQFLWLLFALGLQNKKPTINMVEDIFDVEEDEARDFLTKWREARKKNENMTLPDHWYDHIEAKYGLASSWLLAGNPPIVNPAGVKRTTSSFNQIQKENEWLKQSLADAKDRIEEQKEFIKHLTGDKGLEKNSDVKPAHGVPTPIQNNK